MPFLFFNMVSFLKGDYEDYIPKYTYTHFETKHEPKEILIPKIAPIQTSLYIPAHESPELLNSKESKNTAI